VSRPRRSLTRLAAHLSVVQAAGLLRLPPAAIREAIDAGELVTVLDSDGTALVDTSALLVDLGVPDEVIDRLARRWTVASAAESGTC
jgi:hypothetical protein